MTNQEAIKLALESLKENHYYMIDAGMPNQSMLNKTLIAYKALEEALAKQEHSEMVAKARYNRLRDDYNEAIELLRLAGMAAKKWEEHVNRCQLQGVDLDHSFAPQQRKPVPPSAYESLIRDMTTIAAKEVPNGCSVSDFASHALADAELREHDAPQQRKPMTNENPLLVFAKECVLGAYSETELADAAFRAIEAAHNIQPDTGVEE